MTAAKMTPGPWVAEARPDSPYEWCVTSPSSSRMAVSYTSEANARAIACLPELIEAARRILESTESVVTRRERQALDNLRRILARIDREEA